jgi:hypothetical protein
VLRIVVRKDVGDAMRAVRAPRDGATRDTPRRDRATATAHRTPHSTSAFAVAWTRARVIAHGVLPARAEAHQVSRARDGCDECDECDA